jgi:capsular exopolysaccharide synthesis family protein
MLQLPSEKPDAETCPAAPVDRAAGDLAEESPARAKGQAPAPTALDFLRALRRRWLLGLTLGFLCATAAAAAVWLLFPPGKYVVHTLLHVAANQPQIIFPTAESRADFASYRKTQMALLKSRTVLLSAMRQKIGQLRSVRLQADPVQWLESQLKTDYTLGPELLRVSVSGDNSEDLKVIVSAVVEAYLKEIVNKEHNRRIKRHDRLKDIYNKYEEKLRTKRRTLRELADAIGAGNATNAAIQQRIALEQLSRSQSELAKLHSDVLRLEVEIRTGLIRDSGQAEAPIPEAVLQERIDSDPVVKEHLAKVAKLENAIAEIKRLGRPGAFEKASQEERARLADAHKALQARRKHLRETLPQELREQRRRDAAARTAGLQAQLAFLKKLEESLQNDVKRLARETRTLNHKSFDLDEVNEEIAQAETVLKRVGAEAEALEVERDAPSRVSVVEDAIVSNPNNTSKKTLAAGGAAVVALALVLVAVSWWEFRSRRISSGDEVVKGLGLRLVGTLPSLPARARRRLAQAGPTRDAYWENLLIESVDAARTYLLHIARKESLSVIMVTSAMGGEGKTSLATYLAASLARARRKTVLIDCDFRNPSVHRLFGLPLEPGFSEVLRNEVAALDAVRATPVDGVDLISAGRCDGVVLQELAQGRCGEVFDGLKGRYDFIVVDSAPVLPVVDTLLLGSGVDAVLFSLMHEFSQFPKVYAAYQRLDMLGVRILGAVVNAAPWSEVYGAEYRYTKRGIG